jgi:hypothetical protein
MGADPRKELAARLRDERLADRFVFRGPVSCAEIEAAEHRLGVCFPDDYRWFLSNVGPATLADTYYHLNEGDGLSVETATLAARAGEPPLPPALIVIGLGRFGQPLYLDTSPGDECGRIAAWPPSPRPGDPVITGHGKTLLEWIEKQIQDELRFPHPPRDWNDRGAWERYWHRFLEAGQMLGFYALAPFETYPVASLPLLRERGYRRVLFAGNGISLEPHAFVHAGFDVIALDVAPVASGFVEWVSVDRALLASFFKVRVPAGRQDAGKVDKDASLKQVEQEYRPGGRLSAVTADMFAWAPDERVGRRLQERGAGVAAPRAAGAGAGA